jgi:hypothetical protein
MVRSIAGGARIPFKGATMTTWRRTISILLASIVIGATATAARPDPADHVIITTDALVGAFQRLADYREAQGMSSTVVTLEWIEANVAPGEDLPATIRNFIRFAHDEWGTRWVLLGGDAGVVPARFCMQTIYIQPIPFPADLYYACLDGNWNADGDGIYGEGSDQVDYDAEMAVGRAPVSSLVEAELFVDKTIRFEHRSSDVDGRVLLVAGVLSPSPWHPGEPVDYDAAPYGENLRTLFETANPPAVVTRLYENNLPYPGALALTESSLLDSLASGRYGVIHCHVGGDSLGIVIGDDLVTAGELAALPNAPSFPLLSINRSHGAAFDGDCLLEELMVSDTGGIAAGLGFSGYSYLMPAQLFMESWYVEYVAAAESSLGEIWRSAGARALSLNQGSTVRTMLQGFTLLADPALLCGGQVTGVPMLDTGGRIAIASCLPNPCNPATSITLVVPAAAPVEVSVFDLTGRRIRSLFKGPLTQGTAQLRWNGTDDQGQPAASGVYLVSAKSGGHEAWKHITLVR